MFNLEKAPSLLVEAYNVTTSTAVITWKPVQRNESGVIDVSGYRVNIKSKQDNNHVKFANTYISSLLFEDLKTFTNYCVTVEPLTGLAGLEKDDCYHLRTDDDSKTAFFLFEYEYMKHIFVLRVKD